MLSIPLRAALSVASCVVLVETATAAAAVIAAQTLIDGGALRLSHDEVRRLLSAGAKVETVAGTTGNIRYWINGSDGKIAASTDQSRGVTTGTGTWQVVDGGLYCVEISWKKTEEKWCRAVYRYDNALYLAPNHLPNHSGKSFGLLSIGDAAGIALANPEKASATSAKQTGVKPGNIHMIYMGGNDCPPCVVWRATELPKLQQKEIFRRITYSYVVKTVVSPVPSEIFLPSDVKPLKYVLDAAGSGNRGSSQTAILVDGKVFDYYSGSRSAEEIEQRLVAITNGGNYPFTRCVKLLKGNSGKCADRGDS